MENGASSYRRFLEGDENGIVEIVRDYKDGLMLYLNGYVRNIHTAEDLTEDTFIRLVAKRPRYSDRYAFKTWLYAIGRNLAIDYLRRQKRRSEQPLCCICITLKISDTKRSDVSCIRTGGRSRTCCIVRNRH